MTTQLLSENAFLFQCIWQSTICIGLGISGSYLLRRRPARAHQLLLLAIIAAVTVPMMSTLVRHLHWGLFVAPAPATNLEPMFPPVNHKPLQSAPVPGTVARPATLDERAVPTAATPASYNFTIPWRLLITAGWIAASLTLTTRLLVTFLLGIRLLRRAQPLHQTDIQQAVCLAKAKLAVNPSLRLLSAKKARTVLIWCWTKQPVLLVPYPPAQTGDKLDWTSVICHELAHYKRRDHITGLLTELALCILPWNPLLWWAKKSLVRLSEQACDDWVLASGQHAGDYAKSLLDLLPQRQMAFAPAVVSTKKGLAARISRILHNTSPNPRTGTRWASAANILAATLALTVTFAQSRPAKLDSFDDPAAGILEVQVTYENTGEPVEGARVSFTNENTHESFIIVTDNDGAARAEVAPGDYAMTNVSKEGYKSHKRDMLMIAETGKVDRIEIELGDAPIVTGYVRGPYGDPVGNASVCMVPYGPRDIVTDSDGRFEFSWDPRSIQLLLVARHLRQGLAGAVEFHSDTASPLYKQGQAVEIYLDRGLTVIGTVTDPQGKAIPGAKVAIEIPTGGPHGPITDVTTNTNAEYQIPALPASYTHYWINASAKGYGPRWTEVFLEEAPGIPCEVATIVLNPANLSLSGVVVDSNGIPVNAADVKCWGNGQPGRATITDAYGRFSIQNVCKGNLRIQATKRPWSSAIDTQGGSENIEIVLAKMMVLTPTRYRRQPKTPSRSQTNARPLAATGDPETTLSGPNQIGPRITFESESHDFGDVAPRSKHTCEFKFTNTGDAPLTIKKVGSSCSCAAAAPRKNKKYAPGESGTLPVTYQARRQPGKVSQRITVFSNDSARPRVRLTIKANVVLIISHQPEKLELSLKAENAGCPGITIISTDNQPFVIKSFQSPANCITADFDPAAQATEFVLEPKVDMTRLRSRPKGDIKIAVSHPRCDAVTIAYSAPPRFKVTPPSIMLRDAEPNRPIEKEIWVTSNYNEDFEIEGTSSQSDIMKVLSKQKVGNRCKLEVRIVPAVLQEQGRTFKDVLHINIRDGERLRVNCRGFYPRQPTKPSGK